MESNSRFSLLTSHFNIRPARADEAGLVLEFIKKLAAYEKCADEAALKQFAAQ